MEGERHGADQYEQAAPQDTPVSRTGARRREISSVRFPPRRRTRGTRYVSAQAMQARLFSVYDAAAAAEDALAMVQQQLTLTLDRSYYEADEIQSLADSSIPC